MTPYGVIGWDENFSFRGYIPTGVYVITYRDGGLHGCILYIEYGTIASFPDAWERGSVHTYRQLTRR